MKHLVLITTSYPYGKSGSEAAGAFVADLAYELSKEIRITIIAPGLEKETERISDHLTVIRYQVSRLPLSLLNFLNPLHWYFIFNALRAGKKETYDALKKESADHILALWVLPSGYWAMSAGRKFNIPFSTWALGSDIWSLRNIPMVRDILRLVLRTSQTNYADGYQLAADVSNISQKECNFLPSTRKIILPYKKQFKTTPPYRLAFLGRWHHNKGVDLLVESLQLLEDSDWKLIEQVKIFGGGPLEKVIEKSLQFLKLHGREVSYGGFLNKEKAIELFLWADYVLIPSRIESIPIVFSDAMKCGCPLVCNPVGDLPWLVKQHNVGVLSGEISAKGFARGIREALYLSPMHFSSGVLTTSNLFSLNRTCDVIFKMLNSKFGSTFAKSDSLNSFYSNKK